MRPDLLTCKTTEWETPQWIFDEWNRVFDFQLDSCATSENAKCPAFFTKDDDGILKDWAPYKRVWMNPPYGREIGLWMKKAYEESLKGCIVVCLVPAKTETRWWHDYARHGIPFWIKGRLQFGGVKVNAPFSSVVVVFMKPDHERIVF